MRKSELEAMKAALFKALDREPLTAKMAGQLYGIGHATFDRWRAEWKNRNGPAVARSLDSPSAKR